MDLEIEEPSLEEFKKKYKDNVPEVVGADFLLQQGGIVERGGFRDALLFLSSKAWMEFNDFEGIISPKQRERIMVNPLIKDELEDWVQETKRNLLPDRDAVKNLLKSADIIDFRLEYDEEKGVHVGHVMTEKEEKINVIVLPWYLPDYSSYLGKNNLIIMERCSNKIKNHLKDLEYKNVLLLSLEKGEFEVFSNLPASKFTESVIESFENRFDLRKKEVEATEEVTERPKEKSAEAMPEPEGATPPSLEDPFDKIIESKNKNFPADLIGDRPIVILLHDFQDDDFGTSVQIICRELFRELKGGRPRPKILEKKRDVEEELMAENRVHFIDESNDEFFRGSLSNTKIGVDDRVNWGKVGKRLKELYAQGFGFIIFQLPTQSVSKFKDKLEEETDTQTPQIFELEPKIAGEKLIDLSGSEPREVDLIDLKWRLSTELWGRVLEEEGVSSGNRFDEFFSAGENRFWRMLKNYENQPIRRENKKRLPKNLVNRSPEFEDDRENKESPLHFMLKTFVVRSLIETGKYDFVSVDTEEETALANDTNNNVIPDVQVGNKTFEIETLYSSGKPLSRIKETIEKYKKAGLNPEINLILTNLDAFLRYKDLKRLQKEIKEDWKMEVKLKVPSLPEKKLLCIDEVMGPVTNLSLNGEDELQNLGFDVGEPEI